MTKNSNAITVTAAMNVISPTAVIAASATACNATSSIAVFAAVADRVFTAMWTATLVLQSTLLLLFHYNTDC